MRVMAGPMIVALGCVATPAMAAAQLIAHRAVYDLTLAKSDGSSSAPATARGRIVYEFTGSACEGWVTNFRQITELEMNEGGDRTSDLRSSTFEDGDGSGFQFKNDTYVNNRLMESVDGRAQRSADGGLSVNLSKPASSKTDYEPGPVFPTAQIIAIIDAAKANERTAEIKIYDGSDDGRKVFDTTAIIGRQRANAPGEQVAADAAALKNTPRWPVSVSYFDPAKKDGAPNYVLGFDLYENGVSGALRIDYGTYVLNGAMTKFEALAQKPCEK